MIFPEVVRKSRYQKAVTQTDMAEDLKIANSYLNKIELGHRVPSRKLVFKLADYLDLDRDDLNILAVQQRLVLAKARIEQDYA